MRSPLLTSGCARWSTWACGSARAPAPLLALPLVQSAARALRDVATFDSAGVADKPPKPPTDRRPAPWTRTCWGSAWRAAASLVVGGGAVATRRVPALLDAGAD